MKTLSLVDAIVLRVLIVGGILGATAALAFTFYPWVGLVWLTVSSTILLGLHYASSRREAAEQAAQAARQPELGPVGRPRGITLPEQSTR